MIRSVQVTVTTTGSAGAATGSATVGFVGSILSIFLNHHASAAATTDTTIAYTTVGGNILAVTDSNTDATYYPRAGAVDNTGSAITNSFVPYVLDGTQTITVSSAQNDALTAALVATIVYEEQR